MKKILLTLISLFLLSCSVNNTKIIESNSWKIEKNSIKNEELNLEKNLYINPKINENLKDINLFLQVSLDKKNKFYSIVHTLSKDIKLKENYTFELSHNRNQKNKDFEKIEYSTFSYWWNKNLTVFWEDINLSPDTLQDYGSYTFKIPVINNFFNFKVEVKDNFVHLISSFNDYSWNKENQFEKIIIDFEKLSLKKFSIHISDNRDIKEIYYKTRNWERKILELSDNSFNKNSLLKTKNSINYINSIVLENNLENISNIEIIFK